ncbi:hypothetical protein PoB_001028500 [Plakobranchus ocellatus]|uniref:Uncharacterized protein n=1 Tax=Plakobranchus ocellatus TaxID=259542 RepID=A0AAV3YKX7_9GAST|nr:hypothetical protein PoB_001028500 [Plakobranchus ocellatus]
MRTTIAKISMALLRLLRRELCPVRTPKNVTCFSFYPPSINIPVAQIVWYDVTDDGYNDFHLSWPLQTFRSTLLNAEYGRRGQNPLLDACRRWRSESALRSAGTSEYEIYCTLLQGPICRGSGALV